MLSVEGIQPDLRKNVKIGDADAGLEIDIKVLPQSLNPSQPQKLTPAQQEYIVSLPPTEVLLARASAYEKHNVKLRAQAHDLESRSSDLENQLRRVVSLCTGVEEKNVDNMVEGLVAAVESEREDDMDMGRVREFLRKVDRASE